MPAGVREAVNSGGGGGKSLRMARSLSTAARTCAIALALLAAAGAAGICRDVVFAGVGHVVCEITPAQRRAGMRVDLHWLDEARQPFASLGAVERDLAARGRTALVTMNAGMYEPDLSPVGLFVSGGVALSPLNTRAGGGNFYMKPNGVFFVAGGKAGIMETRAFARSGRAPELATQSGPLMVRAGQIHPRFQSDGDSRKIRNGIGVRKDGTIVLAISRQGISFGQFARLFRDDLRCPDALYLDGSVSQLSQDGEAGRMTTGESVPWRKPLGPVLSVSVK